MLQAPETSRHRWIKTRDGGYVALRHVLALIPVLSDDNEYEPVWEISIRTADLAVRYVHVVFPSRDQATLGIENILSGEDYD